LYGAWYKEPATVGQDSPVAASGTSLGVSQETQGRFRLTGDPAHGDCSLQISDARRTDAGRYFFYIEKGLLDHTYRSNSDGTGPALTISVPGLTEEPEIQISPAWGLPGTLLAREPVTVTCTASGRCSGPSPRVTWTGPFSDTARNVSAQLANGTWAHSSALSFTPGLGDHGKELVCSVTYRPPWGPSTNRTVRLHVGYPPWPPNITGTLTRKGRPMLAPLGAERNIVSLETREGDSLSLGSEVGSRAEAKGHEFQLLVESEQPLAGDRAELVLPAPGAQRGLTRALIEISCKLVFVATGFFLAYYLTLLYYRWRVSAFSSPAPSRTPASHDTDNPSAQLYGAWYKEPATVGQDPPVASSAFSLRVSQETQGRFQLTGNPAHGDCSLQISDARRTDAGRYFFSIEKGLLEHTYRSNSDGTDPALTISVPELTEEPEIQISPALGLPGTLLAGKPVTVTCTAPGRCSGPPPRVTWTGPFSDTARDVSAQLGNGTLAHSSALNFTPGLGDHSKELVCSATYRPPRGPSTRRTVRLHVSWSLSQPPGFTLTVPQQVSVQEGLCVVVPCTFTYPASYDTDNPSAQLYGNWYKEPATVGQDPPVASSVSSLRVSQETQGRFQLTGNPAHGDCSLQISDARRTDAGRYFFSIEKGLLEHTYRSNSDGTDPALTISVPGLTEEPEIEISPVRGLPGTLLAGKPVAVTCTAPGRCSGPPPRVTWTGPFSDTARNVSAQLANGTWAHSSASRPARGTTAKSSSAPSPTGHRRDLPPTEQSGSTSAAGNKEWLSVTTPAPKGNNKACYNEPACSKRE
ncbi:uncharacterized protein LOC120390581, partial [Mauremys reevesii]|uniref:uncharacterized protein LOC120390581 n=1 Tax=Mauremys reevesii TaxID=260615 RepID=UPI00193F7E56